MDRRKALALGVAAATAAVLPRAMAERYAGRLPADYPQGAFTVLVQSDVDAWQRGEPLRNPARTYFPDGSVLDFE